MQITPDKNDFKNWIACVPVDGDIIFLSEENSDLLDEHPFPKQPAAQTKAQHDSIWSLNARSWYGYALNRAAYCVWLPQGTIESFDEKLKGKLAEEQRKLEVPTVVGNNWITSRVWSLQSKDDKVETLKLWMIQNEVQSYESIGFSDLPKKTQLELTETGYGSRLNRYPNLSGPNCFATVAGAFTQDRRTGDRWLHWPDFHRLLIQHGYEIIASDTPRAKDVMTFNLGEAYVHAAYYLGNEIYFEKPGQDFYEPYRIASLNNWQTEWPEAKLAIWRKRE